jgi:tripartite-type tricarboxylate transporter receptor subunit TctC
LPANPILPNPYASLRPDWAGIPGETVAKAPADGYTLLLYGSATWLTPLMQADAPYDPVKDFSPITLVGGAPNVLVVHPSLPIKSIREFIVLARARPGALNYSSGGNGSSSHLAAELFKYMAAVDIVRVAYKSGSMETNDLISGQVQMTFSTPAQVMQYVSAGRLKALAVTSLQPSALVPGLPAIADSVPGYESISIHGMFAPAKTPEAIIRRLHQEIIRFLSAAETKEKFFTVGVEVVASSPEELAAKMKTDMARMGKVIKDAGIRG